MCKRGRCISCPHFAFDICNMESPLFTGLLAMMQNLPFERHPARCSSSPWSSMSMEINALFSQEELRNAFRPYRSALLCAKFSAVSQDKPLVELRHASAIFLQSGLHPSVHKPDMSVWTGSVFE